MYISLVRRFPSRNVKSLSSISHIVGLVAEQKDFLPNQKKHDFYESQSAIKVDNQVLIEIVCYFLDLKLEKNTSNLSLAYRQLEQLGYVRAYRCSCDIIDVLDGLKIKIKRSINTNGQDTIIVYVSAETELDYAECWIDIKNNELLTILVHQALSKFISRLEDAIQHPRQNINSKIPQIQKMSLVPLPPMYLDTNDSLEIYD
jgi:hypothetical protein